MPKSTTGERLVKIETDINYIKDETAEIKTLLKDHITYCDSKYASKWVERAMYSVAGLIITLVVTAVLTGALN